MFVGPKMCTTLAKEGNKSGPAECGRMDNATGEFIEGSVWHSCEEWCLSKGSSPCSKVFGVLRDRGADMTWEGCTLEEPWFFDHTCTTLAYGEPPATAPLLSLSDFPLQTETSALGRSSEQPFLFD